MHKTPNTESRKQIVRKTPTKYLKQKTNSAQNTKVLEKAENKCCATHQRYSKSRNEQCAKHQRKSESRKQLVRKTPT